MGSHKKIELLAPAGDYDSLRAAAENGADAVYLGGKLFNARQLAGNFDLQQMNEALAYAHVRGVNIYLTMNTLISDEEMYEAVDYAKEAWLSGIDGIIVQDMGFASVLHRAVPRLPLHASTQMTIHNLEGAKMLESLGFKRVVLARELSLEEIKNIVSGTSLEIEVFIHGALCISYSGQCLMSSIIGGRSGNRGKCAQPCRLPYKLIDDDKDFTGEKGNNTGYLLSPKDLCTLGELDNIIASGVKSLKIEGRMKSPEYVATVVRIYRKHLDLITGKVEMGICDNTHESMTLLRFPSLSKMNNHGSLSYMNEASPGSPGFSQDMRELEQVFNRGGFTRGYIGGKPGRELMCFEKPKNWGTYLGEILSYDGASEIARVKLEGDISIGDGIEVWNGEGESPGTIVTLIRIGGNDVKKVQGPETVEIGNIKGKMFRGCKVYKTTDKKLMSEARGSFEGRQHKTIELKAFAGLKEGRPLVFKVYDDEGNEAEAESTLLPEKALTKPITYERLSGQLKKTGATVFEISELKADMDEGLSMPVSEINDVRRRALEKLEHDRVYRRQGIRDRNEVENSIRKAVLDNCHEDGSNPLAYEKAFPLNNSNIQEGFQNKLSGNVKPKIALYFYKSELNNEFAFIGADRIYIPFKAFLRQGCLDFIKVCKSNGTEAFIWLPTILRGNYIKLFKDKLHELENTEIDGVLTGNLGVVQILRQNSNRLRLMGDYSLNIFNAWSVCEYISMGFEGLTLSPELTLNQMLGILPVTGGKKESIVYGRLPLMNSEYCPVGCIKGSCKKGDYYLRDRLGIDFPVICDNIDCRSMILNSNILFVPDAVKKLCLAGASILRLFVWNESPEIMKELIGLHRELASEGNIVKYAGIVERIKAGGFTKGHFYRGV